MPSFLGCQDLFCAKNAVFQKKKTKRAPHINYLIIFAVGKNQKRKWQIFIVNGAVRRIRV
jgi:hypothetical protein